MLWPLPFSIGLLTGKYFLTYEHVNITYEHVNIQQYLIKKEQSCTQYMYNVYMCKYTIR